MSTYTVVLPKEFPMVCLAALILCLQCFITGFIVVLPARLKAFNKGFMSKFKEEHQKHFEGSEPSVGGWPDAGEGRYSDKLSYKAWVELNNAMRVHLNFVEYLPMVLVYLMIGGLVLPRAAMWVGFINAFARLIYTYMYV